MLPFNLRVKLKTNLIIIMNTFIITQHIFLSNPKNVYISSPAANNLYFIVFVYRKIYFTLTYACYKTCSYALLVSIRCTWGRVVCVVGMQPAPSVLTKHIRNQTFNQLMSKTFFKSVRHDYIYLGAFRLLYHWFMKITMRGNVFRKLNPLNWNLLNTFDLMPANAWCK